MGRIDKNEVAYRQQLIMQCVWDAGEKVTVQEIIDRLEVKCGKRFSRSAINTLIGILVDKGLLTQSGKTHQAFIYSPTLSREEFQLREIKRFCNLTFEGSPSQLFETLLHADLTEEEREQIKEIVRKASR